MRDIFNAKLHKQKQQKVSRVPSELGDKSLQSKTAPADFQLPEPRVQYQSISPQRKMRTRKKIPSVGPQSVDPGFLADSLQTSHRHVDEYSEVMREEDPVFEPVRAWMPKPPTVSFSTQAENEHIILLLRKHPITQLKWIFSAVGLALVPILFSSISSFDFFPWNYKLGLLILWYLLLTGFIIEAFLKWYFHVFIITDERVIDVDFLSLVYKNVAAAKIDNIEDITAVTSGFIPSLFNYGTVYIQTAGASREFQFEDVPYPAKVTRLLNELLLEEELEKIEGRVT